MSATETSIKVEQLNIFPVKSLAGIELQESALTNLGLKWDRHWMIVMPNGRFVTQRQKPKMALIKTALSDKELVLSSQDQHCSISLDFPKGEPFEATIWRDKCLVVDEGDEVAHWIRQVLDSTVPLRLVRLAKDCSRPQSAPERFGAETTTLFADAGPILVANQASLVRLNSELEQRGLSQVDMRRFRPNIILSGLEAFEEQNIAQLNHQNFSLKLCDRSERCIMTTVDPDTGIKHPDMEPFNTLMSLNTMPESDRKPAFGMNATLEKGSGLIRVGDVLTC